MKINDFKNMAGKADKNVIAVDFDGVIHKNSKGFYDGTIYDEPIEGTKKGLEYLSKRYRVVIYTCKANPSRPLVNGKNGVELIYDWLTKYHLDSYIREIVYGKPNAKYYIDDKAIRFKNWNIIMETIDA
tara:strand:- start:1937 stop:2323 length:387 start_codon:yes stop_codon:yes gene_type:complete